MQDDEILGDPCKPEVLRRQVVPVPTNEDQELPATAPRRAGRWLFLRCPALTAAAIRLQGWRGEARRAEAMRDAMRAFCRINGASRGDGGRGLEPCAGVAILSPDGAVVVAYYGPGHASNTPLDGAAYMAAVRIPIRERLVPVTKEIEVEQGVDMLPLAARTDRPRGE